METVKRIDLEKELDGKSEFYKLDYLVACVFICNGSLDNVLCEHESLLGVVKQCIKWMDSRGVFESVHDEEQSLLEQMKCVVKMCELVKLNKTKDGSDLYQDKRTEILLSIEKKLSAKTSRKSSQ